MAKQELSSSPIVDPSTPVAPALPTPVFGEDGRLTYASMLAIVKHGGSVLFRGAGGQSRLINSATGNIPGELEYAQAGADKSAVKSAADAQQVKINELQAELDRMKGAQSAPANNPNPDGLDDLKVPELKDRAKAAGIPDADVLKRDELLAALRAKPAQQ